ncbi:MAG TPA: hypothetical protein VGC36_14630 [Rhizomicrobium sp.]
MPLRDRAHRALAVLLSVAILIALAIWNRFPLLQYDTGGYLARWYEGTLVPSRAVVYGLILNLGVPLSFWPVLLVQAALTVWVLGLMLRAHGFGGRPWLMFGSVATLSALTTLPFLTAILLTDIFCGLGVLGLYLLLLRGGELGRNERIGLVVLCAVSAATHSATIAVMAALVAAAALVCLIDRARVPRAALGHGVMALVLGAVMVLAANYAVAKRLAWTPGGFALSFGRMLQDGIVNKYLDEHCPDRTLRLCGYKDALPRDADVWFWGSPLFDRLGRFAGLGQEMERIALESLREYPALQIKTAASAAARQLIAVHTGEGVVHWVWHTYFIIHDFAFHHSRLRAATGAGDEGGAPAARRILLRDHKPAAISAGVAVHGAAAGHRRVRLAPQTAGRPRRPLRLFHRRACRQCGGLRRLVQSARPLRRAHRVAGGGRRRSGAGLALRAQKRGAAGRGPRHHAGCRPGYRPGGAFKTL